MEITPPVVWYASAALSLIDLVYRCVSFCLDRVWGKVEREESIPTAFVNLTGNKNKHRQLGKRLPIPIPYRYWEKLIFKTRVAPKEENIQNNQKAASSVEQ